MDGRGKKLSLFFVVCVLRACVRACSQEKSGCRNENSAKSKKNPIFKQTMISTTSASHVYVFCCVERGRGETKQNKKKSSNVFVAG